MSTILTSGQLEAVYPLAQEALLLLLLGLLGVTFFLCYLFASMTFAMIQSNTIAE